VRWLYLTLLVAYVPALIIIGRRFSRTAFVVGSLLYVGVAPTFGLTRSPNSPALAIYLCGLGAVVVGAWILALQERRLRPDAAAIAPMSRLSWLVVCVVLVGIWGGIILLSATG
jgi:hypothetical protein